MTKSILYQERKSGGLCPVCGKQRESWYSLCFSCRDTHRRQRSSNIKRKVGQGLCYKAGCLSPLHTEGSVHCIYHLEEIRRVNFDKITEAMIKLGGVYCVCCGEDHRELLTLDHIQSDGCRDIFRGSGRKKSTHIICREVIKGLKTKTEMQVLCFNCNNGKHRNGGVCPHLENKTFVCCEGRYKKRGCINHPVDLSGKRQRMSRLTLIDCFRHYSGSADPTCFDCGESNLFFLTLDHLKDDGDTKRKDGGDLLGVNLARQLRMREYPEGYRIRCFNCNCGKQFCRSKISPYYDRVGIICSGDFSADYASSVELLCYVINDPTFRLPFGYKERLVSEGNTHGSVQEPFEDHVRPSDLIPPDFMDEKFREFHRVQADGRIPIKMEKEG